MKKLLVLILALITVISLTACGSSRRRDRDDDDDEETTESTDSTVGTEEDSDGIITDGGSVAETRPLYDDDEDDEEEGQESTIAATESPDYDFDYDYDEPTGEDTVDYDAIYGGNTKIYTVGEMSIEMSDALVETQYEGIDAVYGGTNIAVFIRRQDFDSTDVDSSWTVVECAQAIVDMNSDYEYSDIYEENGYALMSHVVDENAYINTVYKSEEAFWLIQYACYAKDVNEVADYFEDWANSVTFDE